MESELGQSASAGSGAHLDETGKSEMVSRKGKVSDSGQALIEFAVSPTLLRTLCVWDHRFWPRHLRRRDHEKPGRRRLHDVVASNRPAAYSYSRRCGGGSFKPEYLWASDRNVLMVGLALAATYVRLDNEQYGTVNLPDGRQLSMKETPLIEAIKGWAPNLLNSLVEPTKQVCSSTACGLALAVMKEAQCDESK